MDCSKNGNFFIVINLEYGKVIVCFPNPASKNFNLLRKPMLSKCISYKNPHLELSIWEVNKVQESSHQNKQLYSFFLYIFIGAL